MGPVALIDVLDRDGSVRASHKVAAWPLRVGRAIDNDVVLDDPHVAAHHFTVGTNDDGVCVSVGDTVNGLRIGSHRLQSGDRWQAETGPFTVLAGRTALRLRLAEHGLVAERPLARTRDLHRNWTAIVWLGLLNLAVVMFHAWLEADPSAFAEKAAREIASAVTLVIVWCGGWALLSKLFARRDHFDWHVRVLLSVLLALEGLSLLTAAVAFALSWPWIDAYGEVQVVVALAIALHFHLQAVVPHRPRLMRVLVGATLVVGLSLKLGFTWQQHHRFTGQLYQTALFPPAMRLASPVAVDTFIERAGEMESSLDAEVERGRDDRSDGDDQDGTDAD